MLLPRSELRAAFNQWWQLARTQLPNDAVEDEYFEDFCDCYSRVKHALGANVMDRARNQAASQVHSEDVQRFGERTARLLAVCRSLASMSAGGVFFLSMRDAGKAMGTSDPYAPKKALHRLVTEGLLAIVEQGTAGGRRATRYRLVSTPQGSAPQPQPQNAPSAATAAAPTHSTPQPQAPVAEPAPSSTPAPDTAQGQLAKIVTEAGYTFDDFYQWAIGSDLVTGALAMTRFDDVPDDDAKRLIRAKVGVLQGLRRVSGFMSPVPHPIAP